MPKKAAKTEKTREFVNPFSEAFIPIWELWKTYKKEEFKFSYKSSITEQAAVAHLVELSGGNEQLAGRIIKQSMENGWKGLFELKTDFVNASQRQRADNNSQATRESVNNAYSKRFGSGG